MINVAGIQGFEETYYSVGGINVPKKIICICSDGVKRPQLVKVQLCSCSGTNQYCTHFTLLYVLGSVTILKGCSLRLSVFTNI